MGTLILVIKPSPYLIIASLILETTSLLHKKSFSRNRMKKSHHRRTASSLTPIISHNSFNPHSSPIFFHLFFLSHLPSPNNRNDLPTPFFQSSAQHSSLPH